MIVHGLRERDGLPTIPCRGSDAPLDHIQGTRAMPDSTRDDLLKLTQRLLDGIASGDWATYQELCDPTLTAIEPEARGVVVEGLPFHKFYFDLGGIRGPHHTTISAPHV